MGQIVTRTLACGMPLIVERIESVRSCAVVWSVPGGAAYDPVDRLGRATMWAELVQRGTGSLDSHAFADAMDRLGALRGVSVGSYFLQLSMTTLADQLAPSLPLFLSMVREPLFPTDGLEPARDLALQAISSLKDDPTERAMIATRRRHYPAPLNRSTLGDEAGISALTRDEIVRGWASVARPGGSIFGAAGAVDPDALARDLDRLLAGWSGTTAEPAIQGPPPRGYAHETDTSEQVQIIVAHDAPPEKSPDSWLERVVVSVLSGGMSGRLFSEVREKRGLCYSVNASYRSDRDFGTVTAYVGTKPERAQESIDVLTQELQRIGTPEGRVTPEEFSRAMVGLKSSVVFSGESTGARAGALVSDYHRIGRARTLADLTASIDRLTLDDVNAYLARRQPGRFTTQTVGSVGVEARV